MAEPLLSQSEMHALHAALVDAGLATADGIAALLAELPLGYATTLPSSRAASERLVQVLAALNRDRLSSGEFPLRIVLQTAVVLSGERESKQLFKGLLVRLTGSQLEAEEDSV